ncbi:hypothetical protein HAX54_037017 [Datura stramonium]|uniref:Uncharacterized protein n=1 Tax=Datura stramonium TaxID=4076 RepID=A0ABS8SGT6_DATST|nr:hypothetical protein [Datura stramonium]
MRIRVDSRLVTEQRHDEEVRPYIQQLMKAHNCSQGQTYYDNNSVGIVGLNNEPDQIFDQAVWELLFLGSEMGVNFY